MNNWTRRGWCRLERAARELSANHSWILVQSSDFLEVVSDFVPGTVGEGEFTIEEDRTKLAVVMRDIIKHKHPLSQGRGFAGLLYRRNLNLQNVHLRHLQVEPIEDVLPTSTEDQDLVEAFFYQNGFRKNHREGWGRMVAPSLCSIVRQYTAGQWPAPAACQSKQADHQS